MTGRDGPREVPITELHRLPDDTPDRDTTLEHGDLITAVSLPPPEPGTVSAYRKARDRASYAFALVSIAVVAVPGEDGRLSDVRIAFGGLAHKPWRAQIAEAELHGALAETDRLRAAADAELAAAAPTDENAFKIPLARNLLIATVGALASGEAAR